MATIKKIQLNGTNHDIGADSTNVDYTGSVSGVNNVKSAIDNLQTQINNVPQGGGGGGSTVAPNIYVYGDSTASDSAYVGSGYASCHANPNIYKIIAKLMGCTPSNYHNAAIHGGVISGMSGNSGSDADYVFVQIGINNVSQSSSTVEGMMSDYTTLVNNIRTHSPNAKIVCVSPLYNHSYEGEKLTGLRNGINSLCESNGGHHHGYYYISGLAVGVDSGNYSALYVDNTHPNEQGAVTIARHIIDAVKGYDDAVFADTPVLECSTTKVQISASAGGTATGTFTFSTIRSGNLTLEMSGTNASLFSVSPTSVTAVDGDATNVSCTVTYSPQSAGTHTARIIFRCQNVSNYISVLDIEGTAS